MASRLLQREQKEGETATVYDPPASVAVAPVPPAPAATIAPLMEPILPVLPSGAEVPTVLLARHEIEAELLGAPTRNVAYKPKPPAPWMFFILLPTIINTYPFLKKHPQMLWLLAFPALALVARMCGFVFMPPEARKRRNLLATGLPRRAFVETVGEPSFLNGTPTATFWYENAHGQLISGTVNIPLRPTKIAALGIEPGFVFTVLVSADSAETLPYFLADEYKVSPVMRTDVSDAVSVRVAQANVAYAAAILGQSGTRGAIEPELLRATPRTVRATAKLFRKRQRVFASFAALVTFAVLYCQYFDPRMSIFWFVVTSQIFAHFVAFKYFSIGHNQTLSDRWLRYGTPTRAVVTNIEDLTPISSSFDKQKVAVHYKYGMTEGAIRHSSVTVARRRAWQLGLCVGATFTVLHDPKVADSHTPYFEIADAELVGAMGARVSPPLTP